MIIKGLFRRYQKWNPVHPTLGTFWGMGIGIGCGVGWGPGFGPEVIGYVGAGCGVGFSVGFTLAGVGIGIPMNGVMQIPYSAFSAGNGALDLARSSALPTLRSLAGDSWNHIAPHVSSLRNKTLERQCNFKISFPYQQIDVSKLSKALSAHAQSTVSSLEAFRDRCWPPGQGT